MNQTRFYRVLLLILMLAVLLAGCGGGAAPESEEMDTADSEEADYDVADTGEGSTGDRADVENYPQDRMIIKNGEMLIIVEDIDTAVSRITQIATDNGGYLLGHEVYQMESHKAATLTIAVYAERYEAAMERIRQAALKVEREFSTSEDVTAEFVDLESRLTNLEATRDRLQTFLDQAETVEDALDVNNELTKIEAEIEQVKGRMKYLQGRAAMSTITINLRLPDAPIEEEEKQPFGEFLKQTGKTQSDLFSWVIRALTWLIIVPGPYLLVIGLIAYGGSRWRKRRHSTTT